MATLEFNLKIPIESEPIVSAAALTFARWLPLDEDDALVAKENNVEARLYFKIESTWWASRPTVDELPHHVNVLAHRLWADVRAVELSPELVEYACTRDYSADPKSLPKDLECQLQELGTVVVQLTLRAYNRLVDFARSEKGQYWLKPYSLDLNMMASLLTSFEARVREPGGTWNGFRSGFDTVAVELLAENLYLTQDDWSRVKDWIESNARPPLVGSLLAGAEELAGAGHTRSALTEAVTALEVALFRFAKRPQIELLLETYSPNRVGLESLKAHVKHLGFSCSLAYLLPVLIPEEALPTAVLKVAKKAVEARQSVVHEGKRAVSQDMLRDFLVAIRRLCKVLEDLTESEST